MKEGFYCLGDFFAFNGKDHYCTHFGGTCREQACRQCRRKHPTPEQFREEYGREYSPNMPVWILLTNGWELVRMGKLTGKSKNIICACTPFGPPPNDFEVTE